MSDARFMLDTNIVSHLLRRHPQVLARVQTKAMAALCMSAITAGELEFGLAKRPGAKRLHAGVAELLLRVDVLPWDATVPRRYGALRATTERSGRPLGALDALIAAHALATDAVLVTNDHAFRGVKGLTIEDWTRA